MNIQTYNEQTVREAIEKEGLCADAWGYKTKGCIFVFEEGMESDEVWEKLPTPLRGFEQAHYNRNVLEPVRYFIIDKNEYNGYTEGYEGNVSELEDYVKDPFADPDKVTVTRGDVDIFDDGIWLPKEFLQRCVSQINENSKGMPSGTLQSSERSGRRETYVKLLELIENAATLKQFLP